VQLKKKNPDKLEFKKHMKRKKEWTFTSFPQSTWSTRAKFTFITQSST